MRPVLILAVLLPTFAQAAEWRLLSREEGCVPVELLVRAERLPRTPESPEEFAQMMRERGESVQLVALPDLPPELAGRVVQVKVRESLAPVFMEKALCSGVDGGR